MFCSKPYIHHTNFKILTKYMVVFHVYRLPPKNQKFQLSLHLYDGYLLKAMLYLNMLQAIKIKTCYSLLKRLCLIMSFYFLCYALKMGKGRTRRSALWWRNWSWWRGSGKNETHCRSQWPFRCSWNQIRHIETKAVHGNVEGWCR